MEEVRSGRDQVSEHVGYASCSINGEASCMTVSIECLACSIRDDAVNCGLLVFMNVCRSGAVSIHFLLSDDTP